MPIDVSVILPIFNIREEYLRKCIESLIHQTKKEIEIILVDDGSQNNAYEICLYYEKQDPRVKAITQENQGVSVARNRGIIESKGDWICFVDPDDWVSKDYIEKLYGAAINNNVDIVQCGCYVYYSDSKIVDNHILNQPSCMLNLEHKRHMMNQIISKALSDYYPPEIACGTPWSKIVKRSYMKRYGLEFIPGMVRMQDGIFSLYAFENTDKIYYLDELIYFYRKEKNSASFRYNPTIVSDFEKFYYEVEKYQEKFNRPECEKVAFQMKKLTSFNSYLLYYFFHKDNPKNKSDKRKELSELLEKKIYANAIAQIDRKYLRKSEFIFVFLLKHKCYRSLEFLVKSRNKVKM